jgi:opacity protein-like surface antigen
MMTTFRRVVMGVVAAAVLFAPAAAQAQITRVSGADTKQSLTFHLGAFLPNGEDSRADGDVLFTDLDSLLFEIKDFRGFSGGAEWAFALTNHVELGADVSFYSKSVPSIYRSVFNETTGGEIEQELKLRIIPMTAVVKFVPTGRDAGIQPYVGIGAAFLNWRYTETGEFVDFSDDSIFHDAFVAKGTKVAPVVLGGVRFLANDAWTVGGEVRWHKATGDTGGIDKGFLNEKIDLGGWTTNFTFGFRF